MCRGSACVTRVAFGAERFDRMLYEVVAPGLHRSFSAPTQISILSSAAHWSARGPVSEDAVRVACMLLGLTSNFAWASSLDVNTGTLGKVSSCSVTW